MHDPHEPHIPDYVFPTLHRNDVSANNYAACESCGLEFLKDSSGSGLCHRPKCVLERQEKQREREAGIECRVEEDEIAGLSTQEVAGFIEKKLVEAGVPLASGHVETGTLTHYQDGKELVFRWSPRKHLD